jgi:pimeloyl-ACP methyl ester carboxylesterase
MAELPSATLGPAGAGKRAEGEMTEIEVPLVHDARRVNGITMHYVRAGEGPPLVLLHGWGSTWYMWRKVMAGLARDFTVIAPDLRGIGDSSKPPGGYDKLTLAHDVHALVHELDLGPILLVGHDWGGPVAYLYAATFAADVQRLAMLETALPGLQYEFDVRLAGELWHNAFHAVGDLPEALIVGRERTYLRWFYEHNAYDPSAIEPDAVDEYVRCYSGVGALRASLEWYRSGAKDAHDTQQAARTRLTLPVLALGGDHCLGNTARNAMRAVADDVTGVLIARCGHWMPEERPAETLAELQGFLG